MARRVEYLNGYRAAAEYTQISERMLWDYVADEQIPVTRIGRRVYFDPADLDRFMAAHRVKVPSRRRARS